MTRRPEPFWVRILKHGFYEKHPPNLSFHIPRGRVSEARRAIEAQISVFKATLEGSLTPEEKSKILDERRETLAREYVQSYRERIESMKSLSEVQAPPAELSPEEILDKIKAFIHTRITTQQGPRRHNDVSFGDSTISLLAEFYLNAHQFELNLDRIHLRKRDVIDLLTFIELTQGGKVVTLEEIRNMTGYQTPDLTISIISGLKKGTHLQFKLGGSYVINGDSGKGWTLERVESDSSY